MADSLVIRSATLDDYQGVMDIGKLYDGLDYLPVQYEKYLKRFNCYVGEIDGEIVAFHADRLVDAGVTIVNAAARVKESFQGRGILAAILKHVRDSYVNQKTVKYEIMTVNNVNVHGEKIKRKFTLLLERILVEFIGDVGDFNPNKFESDQTAVQELTSEDLQEIFQSKDTCSRLFPGERIVPNWYPYRLLAENIPLMVDWFKFWGTKISDQSTYKTLTVTEHFNLGEMLIFKLCIYGNDVVDIQQHCLKHIQNLNLLVKMGTCTSIIVHITYSLDFQDTATFLSMFEKCGFKINDDLHHNRMLVYEREIK